MRTGTLASAAVSACVAVAATVAAAATAAPESRFPPPQFDTGHHIPAFVSRFGRPDHWATVDAALLVAALAVATACLFRLRSRRAVLLTGIACLAYFGFVRHGCVCPVGALQNVTLALFDRSYAVPWVVLLAFALPLALALLFGRVFCGGVCPLGAIQELVIVRPIPVGERVGAALGLVPYVYLGLAVLLASTGTAFVICRFDPFVSIFRVSGPADLVGFGVLLLAAGTVVARPYCRFLCPYGALLGLFSTVPARRLSPAPDRCASCGLCAGACPSGNIRPPARHDGVKNPRRLLWLLLLPLVGAWAGGRAGAALATLSADVSTVELLSRGAPESNAWATARLRAFEASTTSIDDARRRADETRERFRSASRLFGLWVGLVILCRMLAAARPARRADYSIDPAGCLACGRCLESCPFERERLRGQGFSADRAAW